MTQNTTITFLNSLNAFLRSLAGQNRSAHTIQAYETDVTQFVEWLPEITVAASANSVERADITEYLAHLAQRGISGISRARKLAAIREFFRFLEAHDCIARNPTQGVPTPRKERNGRTYLQPDEYRAMLAQAGARPRDYAILQTFLQTGVRVSELCELRLSSVDFADRTVKVWGKGQAERQVELERKGLEAIKNYLIIRPPASDDHLFLNKDGQPISERMVRKIVVKYKDLAGITKKASCHSLRHTFATYKAERGVSPFQLQQWLGHANLNTTQIYVHMGRQNAKKLMEATSL